MNNNPIRILIVEDDAGFSNLLCQAAREQGHEVVAVLGAASMKPLIGISPTKEEVPVDAASFQLALCDYELKKAANGARFRGVDFVGVLVPAGVVCHGISSAVSCNTEMTAIGAKSGVIKPLMLLAVKENVVTFREMLEEPDKIQALVDTYCAEAMKDKEGFNQRLLQLCD